MLKDGDVVHGIEVKKEKLQKRSLLIATPMYQGNCTGLYAASLLRLGCWLQAWGIKFEYLYQEGHAAGIPRDRNMIATGFLKTEYTNLLLLDADIGFQAEDVLVMLAAEKGVIAAPYPLKRINWEKVRQAARGGATKEQLQRISASDFVINYQDQEFDINQPVRVQEAGAGCMLISRGTLLDLIRCCGAEQLGSRTYEGEPQYNGYNWRFFDTGVDERGFAQPEDYWFCKRVRELGGTIWLCPWMTVAHRGAMNFVGSVRYAFLEGGKFNVVRKKEEKKNEDPESKSAGDHLHTVQ